MNADALPEKRQKSNLGVKEVLFSDGPFSLPPFSLPFQVFPPQFWIHHSQFLGVRYGDHGTLQSRKNPKKAQKMRL